MRVANPDWDDPLSGEYARAAGGRWNPPGSFPVVYLNRDERVARANVRRKYEGLPYGPEDLDPLTAPILVGTDVPRDRYIDIVTGGGCEAAGLAASYPRDDSGATIPHASCRPIGQAAWDGGAPGIACRSAAPAAPPDGEELAFFVRGARLTPFTVRSFEEWF